MQVNFGLLNVKNLQNKATEVVATIVFRDNLQLKSELTSGLNSDLERSPVLKKYSQECELKTAFKLFIQLKSL